MKCPVCGREMYCGTLSANSGEVVYTCDCGQRIWSER